MQRTGVALQRTGGALDRTGVALRRYGGAQERNGGALVLVAALLCRREFPETLRDSTFTILYYTCINSKIAYNR